ncbi:MAG: DUF1573 domain-containing protein [Spirochaetales bacterium]|nr:DUF1573 domain-containing protein [Spirochaetales bacterium]
MIYIAYKKIAYRGALIILLCIIGLFLSCSGKRSDGLVAEFITEIYNFGQVNEGEKVTYTFKFKNVGTKTIIIDDVRTTCGCTLIGEFDREVAPGASGKIPVELDTDGFEREIAKAVQVTTNIPDRKEIILTLRGTVYSPIIVRPRILWLGLVTTAVSSLHGTFSIKNNSDVPLKIEKIIPPHDGVIVRNTSVQPDEEYLMDVTVNPPFGEGNVDEVVVLKTNMSGKESVNLTYSYYNEAADKKTD